MKRDTLQKIMGDPEFDPQIFAIDAIAEFVERNPEKVAKDKVALRYLIADRETSHLMWEAVDINDVAQLDTWMKTLTHGTYNSNNAIRQFMTRLREIAPENLKAVYAVINKFTSSFDCLSSPTSLQEHKAISREHLAMMTCELAVVKKFTNGWTHSDWEAMLDLGVDPVAFIEALEENRVRFDTGRTSTNNYQIVSDVAKLVRGGGPWKRLLDACRKRWPVYTCFHCGRDNIKSISGYTLHRSLCDPNELHQDPWQITKGRPRELEFPCDNCTQIFTTASGLTLHRKSAH